jgi:hypothetical protein
MKSSVTSQKYSCPGREQNQLIHVSVEVGVDEAGDKLARILNKPSPAIDKDENVPEKIDSC